ncbi:protein hunchback, partial [Frankliniella occidentalis]|uniref:Protein hunchback n=1 Tax=Frankliniella occidentalis TaxID=133901 RepID=A0A9C6XW39_FRAOC
MSVSVPSMNAAMGRLTGPLSSPLSSMLGYDGAMHGSLMVGTPAAASPRTSPHHSATWGCPQVKQEPIDRDHDSSGVSSMASSMAHGSSFLSSAANTSPSSSSSAGSPPGHHGYHHLHHPSSPAGAAAPVHSTPVAPHPGPASSPPTSAAPAAASVPRTPGSVDDNSRSSTCSNSEDDADEQVRRLRATLEGTVNGGHASPLQCQLCSFTADSRERLSEHVAAHFKCTLCDFSAASTEGLRAHLQDAHDLQMPQQMSPQPCEDGYSEQDQEEDLEGVATPRVNSQGKVKTFRCKQCDFVAVTKLDFWEHTKLHIKQEKMLCCPKCPFVTEYKHHLEYHLRNHFNSKPFKCDKCSYSCVNKSMLNSHLKSHSNVYQYRCADCTYATKYCHSLKLHLRKYGHQPSMVLNPDGSPNPLPIIDVYGTRRGPKSKTSKAAQAALQQHQLQQQVPLSPQQFGMFPNPYGLPPIFPYPAGPQDAAIAAPAAPAPVAPRQGSPLLHRCNYCEFSTPEAEVLAQHVFVHAEAMQSNLMQYFSSNNNNNYYQDDAKGYFGKTVPPPVRQASPPAVVAPPPAQSPPRTPSSPVKVAPSPAAATPVAAPVAALDLSKPETGVQEEVRETKNRRKGRAFKLERIAMRLQHQSSGDEAEPDQLLVKVPRLSAEAPAASAGPA